MISLRRRNGLDSCKVATMMFQKIATVNSQLYAERTALYNLFSWSLRVL